MEYLRLSVMVDIDFFVNSQGLLFISTQPRGIMPTAAAYSLYGGKRSKALNVAQKSALASDDAIWSFEAVADDWVLFPDDVLLPIKAA